MRQDTRKYFLLLSLIIFGIFLYVSVLVDKDTFRTVDYITMLSWQNLAPRIVDIPFSIISLTGSSEVIFLTIGTIFLYIYFKRKHTFFGIALIGLIFLIELIGKLLIYHPKPPSIFVRYALHIVLPSSFVVDTAYSFPSGHMSRWMFVATILIYLFHTSHMKKISKYLWMGITVFLVLIVFFSRVYLAEHWLSDVIGGVLLGSAVGTLALSFW